MSDPIKGFYDHINDLTIKITGAIATDSKTVSEHCKLAKVAVVVAALAFLALSVAAPPLLLLTIPLGYVLYETFRVVDNIEALADSKQKQVVEVLKTGWKAFFGENNIAEVYGRGTFIAKYLIAEAMKK